MPAPKKKAAPAKTTKAKVVTNSTAKKGKSSGPVFEARFSPDIFNGLSQKKKNQVAKAMNESLKKAIENHLPQLHADLVPHATDLGISHVRLLATNKKADA